jgi:hypothetical protein
MNACLEIGCFRFSIINRFFGELDRRRTACEHFKLLPDRRRKTRGCVDEHIQRFAGECRRNHAEEKNTKYSNSRDMLPSVERMIVKLHLVSLLILLGFTSRSGLGQGGEGEAGKAGSGGKRPSA